jgi:hypothetical protein
MFKPPSLYQLQFMKAHTTNSKMEGQHSLLGQKSSNGSKLIGPSLEQTELRSRSTI